MNDNNTQTQLELERITTVCALNRFSVTAGLDTTQTQRKQQLETKLHRVEAALHRLAQGCYGLCLECGSPITPERLAVIPYTELCYGCQRRLEKTILNPYVV